MLKLYFISFCKGCWILISIPIFWHADASLQQSQYFPECLAVKIIITQSKSLFYMFNNIFSKNRMETPCYPYHMCCIEYHMLQVSTQWW